MTGGSTAPRTKCRTRSGRTRARRSSHMTGRDAGRPERSISGACTCSSRRTKATAASTPAASATSNQGSPYPRWFASERYTSGPAAATVSSTAPTRSAPSSARLDRLRGKRNHPSASPIAPAGRLTRKISRHPPSASSRPPIAGPSASPSACAAPCTPMPLAEQRPGHRLGDQRDAVGLKHRSADRLKRHEPRPARPG